MLRFALAPTAPMRVGDLRLALLNYLAAKRRGERFIVRIEDGDRERNVEGLDRQILDILDLFGVRYDDVAYQSRNLTLHQHMAIKLLQERRAFACFCGTETDDEVPYEGGCDRLADAEVIDNPNPFTVRLKKPERPVDFEDLLQGPLSFAPDAVDSFVILRTDKSPTPDFAAAVDDMLHDISLVFGEEAALLRTSRQIAVRDALGYDRAVAYAHPGSFADEAAALEVKALLEEGFLPEAIANYLLLLSLDAPKELFFLEEAAEWFDFPKVRKTPAPFDIEKLRALNREHMRLADPKELSRAFGFADADIGNLVKCHLDEGSTVREIRPRIDTIFAPKPFAGEHGDAMRRLQAAMKEAPLFDDFGELRAHLIRTTGLEGDSLEGALRLLLTGAEEGPDMAALYPHLKNYLQEIIQ